MVHGFRRQRQRPTFEHPSAPHGASKNRVSAAAPQFPVVGTTFALHLGVSCSTIGEAGTAMAQQRRILISLALLVLVALPGLATASRVQNDQQTGLPEFTLGPSDVVRTWVWHETDLSTRVVVRPDGKISLPFVGEVDVAGRSPSSLEQEIAQRLGEYLDPPILVVVIVEEINSPHISVLGEVRTPNRFPLRESLTVLDAIALAGGLTQYANDDEVFVLRQQDGGIHPITVRLKDLLEKGSNDPLVLRPGDTVYVR